MTTANNQIVIPNSQEPTKPLIMITIHNFIKLTTTKYLSWKLQIETILIGYDLQKFIDGSHLAPPEKITKDNKEESNPEHTTWVRQDKLIFGALVGTLLPSIIPIITQSKTCHEFWQVLANTYARPSRGHIKQIKDQLKRITQGALTISDYMQSIKARADELAVLGKPLDQEDLIEKILDELDDEYQSVIDAVNGRETTISFDELHEKLINKELTLQQKSGPSPLPTTANPTNTKTKSGLHNNRFSSFSPKTSHGEQKLPPDGRFSPRPFLGRCQWCSTKGHVLANCPNFR